MKLFYHPLSSYSRKTAIGLALRGDAVEYVSLDAMSGALKSPEHLARNPFGKMPVLETATGEHVYESTSILEYVEETFGPRLIPPSDARRARHFDRLGDLYFLDPIGAFFWNKSDDVRAKTAGTMAKAATVWESALADGRPFVLGDSITLGDLSAAVALDYAKSEGVEVSPTLAAYRDRLFSDPVLAASATAAMPFIDATKPRRTAPRA